MTPPSPRHPASLAGRPATSRSRRRAFVFPADDVAPFVEAAVWHGAGRFTVLSSLGAAEEFRAEASQYVPAGIIDMLLDYWRDTLTVPDQPRPVTPITGEPGRTLEQWARDHRDDFAAQQ